MKNFALFFFIPFLFLGCFKQDTTPLYRIGITENGVNGINDTTLYNASLIAPKLLGYDIEHFSTNAGGEMQSILRVTYETREVMLILPNKPKKGQEKLVHAIIVTSKNTKNPLGIEIGENFDGSKFTTCHDKENRRVCSHERHNNIYALYKKNSEESFKLYEIVWTKDSAAL